MGFFNNFPYTNFHELNIDWVLKVVKEYIEKTDKYTDIVIKVKEYVENYFRNLDVQEEVDNAINKLLEDGTLGEIISAKVGYLTPQMFGAKADGVNDDSDSVQNCVNSGLNIFFPEGKYKITKTIKVRSFLTLYGVNNKTSTILPYNMDDIPVISNGIDIGSGNTNIIKDFVMRNIGIEFVSNNRKDYIVKLVNPVSCTLDRVYIINGANLLGSYSAVYMGAEKYTEQPSWINRVEHCHFHMVMLHLNWCSDNWIQDNYFNNILSVNCIFMNRASGTMISNNQIIGELHCEESEYLIIDGNYFDGGGAHDTGKLFNGLYLGGTVTNCTISNNRFYQISKCGVVFVGTLNNISVNSCIFEDCDCYNNGYDDVAITVQSPVPPNMTISNCKHRHISYWTISSGIAEQHFRDGTSNNGKPYSITGVTDADVNLQNYGLIIINNANLFQAEFYAAASSTGLTRFVACTPAYKFPSGLRGLSMCDSGISTISVNISDDNVVLGHINFHQQFTTPPAVSFNFYSQVAIDYFHFAATNVSATGFDVAMKRTGETVSGTFNIPISWTAITY